MRGSQKRRAFVAFTAVVFIMAGCTTPEQPDEEDQAPEDASVVTLDVTGGDSYSWTQRVSGRADCDEVAIEVNGEEVGAGVEMNGRVFDATVPISPGPNEVAAACVGDDEATSEPVSFEGRLRDAPTARIEVSVKGDRVRFDASRSSPSALDKAEIRRYAWSPGTRRVAGADQSAMTTSGGQKFRKASGARLSLDAPSKDGEYFVTLEITDEEGRSDASTTYFEVEGGAAREVDLMHEHPEWVDDAVIYAPIPALFGNGGPKAVQRRLPYLKRLGVDALWLWPPTSLRTAGEEYAVDDYFETDPEWGPDRALKEMIDEAHRLGMYVLIDFVPNHMSAESDYFKETEELGERSAYWDFFHRRDGEPTHYFDWDHLPNLNFDNPEVRRMIMEASAYWVRDMGVDGFRMDVACGVKKRAPGFWPQWRRELKRIYPDLLLLAEASAVDPYYFSNGFDLAYDWSKALGNWAWASAFEFPQEAGALLLSSLTNGHKGYAKDALIMRFLNNNDTGIRFVDQHGAKLTRTAATMQFTLPGLPAMFAGDEIGASYEPYSNLTRIPWKDKHHLMPTYERLIDLKHSEPALESREFDLLEADQGSVLGYVRPAFAGGDAILTILNFGGKGRVEVSGPALDAAGFGPGTTRDLITGEKVRLSGGSGSLAVTMDGESAIVVGGGR